MFVLYLRPVLKATERACIAAERASLEMEVAAVVSAVWVRCAGGCLLREMNRVMPPLHKLLMPLPRPMPRPPCLLLCAAAVSLKRRCTVAAAIAAAAAACCVQEMERTARLMQEDLPLTFQDVQRTSKEFEILGKISSSGGEGKEWSNVPVGNQSTSFLSPHPLARCLPPSPAGKRLNYLAGVVVRPPALRPDCLTHLPLSPDVSGNLPPTSHPTPPPISQVKPVVEPVEWVGKAAESTSSSVQRATTTSIRRVVDDIKTLANVGAGCCPPPPPPPPLLLRRRGRLGAVRACVHVCSCYD